MARSTVGRERRELALPLGGRLLAEVVVTRAEVDVRRVDDPEHRGCGVPPSRSLPDVADPGSPARARTAGAVRGVRRERGAPMTPRSPTRMLAGHCDRYGVTVASHGAGTASRSLPDVRPDLAIRMYPAGHYTGAPREQGLRHRHLGRAAPASPADLAVPSADAAALRTHAPREQRALGGAS